MQIKYLMCSANTKIVMKNHNKSETTH